jgi:hypothetical protein
MEPDRVWLPSCRFLPNDLGALEEVVVRDDVEAMELGCVKIAYVDFEGPALRPRGCCGVVVLLCLGSRELVRTFAVLFDVVVSPRWDPRIAESEGWRPGGGYVAVGTV